eukprot:8275126-Pyramimonas_sp.AAC.1
MRPEILASLALPQPLPESASVRPAQRALDKHIISSIDCGLYGPDRAAGQRPPGGLVLVRDLPGAQLLPS